MREQVLCWYLWRCLRECREICYWWLQREEGCRTGPLSDRILPDRTSRGLDEEGCTLSAEIKECGELAALVVASQQIHCIFELDFNRQDQRQHFDWEAPPVHIIPQEEILRRLQRTPGVVVHDLDEVVELAVNVANDGHGVLNLDHVWFLLCVGVVVRKTALARLRSSTMSFLWSFPSRLRNLRSILWSTPSAGNSCSWESERW